MDIAFILLIATIGVVVAFDFTNGFHDSADMIATCIASRAMKPGMAILLVTSFTFLGPFVGGLAVADTVGQFVSISGQPPLFAESIVLSAVLAAVCYNLLTWKLGLPTSSSNSLVGGLVGSGLYAMGTGSVNWGFTALLQGQLTGVVKIIIGLFFSPLVGFMGGFLLMSLFMRFFRRLSFKSRKLFIFSQYFTTAWLGFTHGTNDAQKGMGIIGMLLLSGGHYQVFTIPDWAILLCASSITLGTLFGGWSIIKTMGFGLYKIRTIHSVADQIGSALVISAATAIGAPASTTQVVTSTLLGVGAREKPRHVHWATALSIIKGWLFNLPISALIGALFTMIFMHLWGTP
jgi:PiT family inorganic phosphate transporter